MDHFDSYFLGIKRGCSSVLHEHHFRTFVQSSKLQTTRTSHKTPDATRKCLIFEFLLISHKSQAFTRTLSLDWDIFHTEMKIRITHSLARVNPYWNYWWPRFRKLPRKDRGSGSETTLEAQEIGRVKDGIFRNKFKIYFKGGVQRNRGWKNLRICKWSLTLILSSDQSLFCVSLLDFCSYSATTQQD